MKLKLKSNNLSISELEDSFSVCFGDMTDSELDNYLMLQCPVSNRSLCPSEIYMEINEQSASVRGGIKQCYLEKERFMIVLNPETSHELGFNHPPVKVEVRFDFDDEQLSELHWAFDEVIFKETGLYDCRL